MTRRRLDSELVRRRLADSRTSAQELIAEGRVTVAGLLAQKPATQVEDSAAIEVVARPGEDWVSRGAHKLLGALEAFADLIPPIRGQHCLDAGASTGGFTEVLLREGAASVVAVDVGYGQLAWKLREDPRVTVLERTNIRHLTPEQALDPSGAAPSLVVSDLSFISLTKVIDNLARCAPDALQILMVKPQFEVGKGRVGAGGVVRETALRVEAVAAVAEFARTCALETCGVAASPLPGPAGNVEYFLLLAPPSRINVEHAREPGPRTFVPLRPVADLDAAILGAVQNGPQEGVRQRP